MQHFPFETSNKIPSGLSAIRANYPDSITKSGISLHLSIIYSHDEFIKIQPTLLLSTKQKVSLGDTCLLILSKFNNYYDVKSYDSLAANLTVHCKYLPPPIPNFIDDIQTLQGQIGKKNINDDLVVYIIDSKQGIFLDKNYLSEGLGLTKEWRNGYSRGVAISEKNNYIIYWVNEW